MALIMRISFPDRPPHPTLPIVSMATMSISCRQTHVGR
jgi:hypothetical protein